MACGFPLAAWLLTGVAQILSPGYHLPGVSFWGSLAPVVLGHMLLIWCHFLTNHPPRVALFRSLDLSPWFAISISWSYFCGQCQQPPPLTFHPDQYHCWSSLPLFSVSQSHHTVFTTGCDKCSNSTAYSTLCTLLVFLHSYDSGTSNFQPIWMAGSLSTSRSLRLTDFNHINVPCTGRLLCGFLRGHLRMAGSFFTHNWQRLTYVDFVDFSPWTRGLICRGLPSHFVLCCHFSLSHRCNPYLCCYIACHSFLWGNLPLIVCWPLRLQCNSYWPGDHNHRSWGRDDLITLQSPQFLIGHMLHRYPLMMFLDMHS